MILQVLCRHFNLFFRGIAPELYLIPAILSHMHCMVVFGNMILFLFPSVLR